MDDGRGKKQKNSDGSTCTIYIRQAWSRWLNPHSKKKKNADRHQEQRSSSLSRYSPSQRIDPSGFPVVYPMTPWIKPPFVVRLLAYASKDIQNSTVVAVSQHSPQKTVQYPQTLSSKQWHWGPILDTPHKILKYSTNTPSTSTSHKHTPSTKDSLHKETHRLVPPCPQRPSSPQPSSQSTPRRPSTVRHPPFPIQGLTTAYSTPKTTRTVHQPHEQLA